MTTYCFSHTDPSTILQKNYCTLVVSIQDADTLADSLYAKGVIAANIMENVHGCCTTKEKNRALIAAVQQQFGVNSESFQTFIDVLKMDQSNQTVVSLLTGKEAFRFGNNPFFPPPPSPPRPPPIPFHIHVILERIGLNSCVNAHKW